MILDFTEHFAEDLRHLCMIAEVPEEDILHKFGEDALQLHEPWDTWTIAEFVIESSKRQFVSLCEEEDGWVVIEVLSKVCDCSTKPKAGPGGMTQDEWREHCERRT